MILNIYMSDKTVASLKAEIAIAVEKNAKEHDIELALIKALIKKESSDYAFALRNDWDVLVQCGWFMTALNEYRLDPNNYKNFCSIGLMQVLYLVAYEMGFRGTHEQFFKPDINIMYGCMLIKRLQHKFTKIQDVISAYNNGGAYFFDLDHDGLHDENEQYKNQAYVDTVYKYYKDFGGVK